MSQLLGEEKRDGTFRVSTLGGDNDDDNYNDDAGDNDDDDDLFQHEALTNIFSDDVIKDSLKAKLSSLNISETAVEFLTK